MSPFLKLVLKTARLSLLFCLLCSCAVCALAQQRGRITGVVRNKSNATVHAVIIIAANQVTSRVERSLSGTDGRYLLRLPAARIASLSQTPLPRSLIKTKATASLPSCAVIR